MFGANRHLAPNTALAQFGGSFSRVRDTAMFSITAAEWPGCRDALNAWLAPENFGYDGTAKHGLGELRAALDITK